MTIPDPSILQLLLFMFLFYGSPGPATISLGSCGISGGSKKGIPYLLGVLFGLFVNISLTSLGLVSLFQLYPSIFEILKFLGIAYLLYLSWKIYHTEINLDGKIHLRLLDGVLINVINPKAYLGSILVLEQVATHMEVDEVSMTAITLVMMVGLVVDVTWLLAGAKLTVLLTADQLSIVNKVLAIFLAIIGIYGLLGNI